MGFSIKGTCCWGNEGFTCGGSGGRWGKGSESLWLGDVRFQPGKDTHGQQAACLLLDAQDESLLSLFGSMCRRGF